MIVVVAVERRKGQAISSPMIIWLGLNCKSFNLGTYISSMPPDRLVSVTKSGGKSDWSRAA